MKSKWFWILGGAGVLAYFSRKKHYEDTARAVIANTVSSASAEPSPAEAEAAQGAYFR